MRKLILSLLSFMLICFMAPSWLSSPYDYSQPAACRVLVERYQKMIKFLRLYIAVFGFVGNISNNFTFDNHNYEIKENKKVWLILLSITFISIPGVVAIICNEINKIYNQSLVMIIIIYISLYIITVLLSGFIAKHFLFNHILKQDILMLTFINGSIHINRSALTDTNH